MRAAFARRTPERVVSGSRTLGSQMPNRPTDAESRAEARRRARLAARGELDQLDAETSDEGDEPARRPSFLERVIPPAKPLPGKGDPMAGFHYDGPLRRLMGLLWLLARNPLAWLVPGLVWLLTSLLPQSDQTVSLLTSVAAYIALIAAGWIGWQRPWLYGVAAAMLGWLPIVAYLLFEYQSNPELLKTTAGDVVGFGEVLNVLVLRTLLQAMLGLVAGWYGGYLRRRLADQRPPEQRTRPRR